MRLAQKQETGHTSIATTTNNTMELHSFKQHITDLRHKKNIYLISELFSIPLETRQ